MWVWHAQIASLRMLLSRGLCSTQVQCTCKLPCEFLLIYLCGIIDQCCLVFNCPGIAPHYHNLLWGWVDVWTMKEAKRCADLIQAMIAWPSHGGANGRQQCRCHQQRVSSLWPADAGRRWCTYMKFYRDLEQKREYSENQACIAMMMIAFIITLGEIM